MFPFDAAVSTFTYVDMDLFERRKHARGINAFMGMNRLGDDDDDGSTASDVTVSKITSSKPSSAEARLTTSSQDHAGGHRHSPGHRPRAPGSVR